MVTKRSLFVSSFALAAASASFQSDPTPVPDIGETEPFEVAAIYLEWNSTDEDIGVHIDTDHDEGLRSLRIVSPRRRTVVDQLWRTRPELGLTELKTESAEPDLLLALQAYVPGPYTFHGATIEGQRLFSTATLSHELLDPPEITNPSEGETGVNWDDLVATWEEVDGAEGYALELSSPDGTVLETFLSSDATSFEVPAQMLEPNTTYSIGVAAKAANGNLSLASVTFTTGD